MADSKRDDTVNVPTPEDFELAKKMVHNDPAQTVPPTQLQMEQEKKAPNFDGANTMPPKGGCCCKGK